MNLSRLLLAPLILRRGNFKSFKKTASSGNMDENNMNIVEPVEKKIRYLPDEVIIHIFNYSDALSVFNCSLASRHFNELAVQIERISVQIPYAIGIQEHVVHVSLPGLLKFLTQFSRVQFAELEFSYDAANPNPESIVRWKKGTQGRIYLLAQKVIPSSDYEGECSALVRTDMTMEKVAPFSALMKDTERDLYFRLIYIEGIVSILPNLELLTAVDSRGQGRMTIDGAQIDFLRGNSASPNVGVETKVWMAHRVEYILKDVCVGLVKLTEVSVESVVQDFCEEQEYREAVMRLTVEAPVIDRPRVESKYDYIYRGI